MTTSWDPNADRVQRYRDSRRGRVIPLPRRPRDDQPTAQCAWHAQPAPGCHFCQDYGPGPLPRAARRQALITRATVGHLGSPTLTGLYANRAQTRCPHGRSVLLDCAACPDPLETVQESTWLLMALLLLVIGATYGVVLLIGPGL